MASLGRAGRGRVVQECGAGLLPLEVGDDVLLHGGAPTDDGPLDPAPLLAAVGLRPEDLAGTPRLTGSGLPWVCLPVAPDAVARARPRDLDGVPGAGVSVFALAAGGPRAGVRRRRRGGRGPGHGQRRARPRRPPRGERAADRRLRRAPGREIGRPSVLRCTVDGDGRATVSGSVVPVARGEVVRPSAARG